MMSELTKGDAWSGTRRIRSLFRYASETSRSIIYLARNKIITVFHGINVTRTMPGSRASFPAI